jgi:hypothetical protein
MLIDTPLQPHYTRPQNLLEDITMTRGTIGLIVSLTLGLLMAPLAVEAQGLPVRMGC